MTETHPVTGALISAIMHSTEPMVLTAPHLADHPMIAINPAFEALTGYAAADTVGRNCRFLQGEETDPNATARIRRCLAEQRGCVEWVVNYRKNGEKFWNLLFITPVHDRDGRLLHFLGNQRDITEGPPPELPDYILGRAELPFEGQVEFDAVLLDLMTAKPEVAPTPQGRARALEGLVESARRLNDLTTRLATPPWAPPGAR